MSDANKKIIDISAKLAEAGNEMKNLYDSLPPEEAGKPEYYKPLQKAINRLAIMFDRTFFLKEWTRQVEERRKQELDKHLSQDKQAPTLSVEK